MTDPLDSQTAWTLIKKIGTCMLVTHDGADDQLRARPMHPVVRQDLHKIFFLVDVGSHKNDEVQTNRNVCLTFADPGANDFVSVTGSASVGNDRARIADVWSAPAKAWWKDASDPNIRLLSVTPTQAEFWDGPGSVVSLVKMAVAAMTGERPELGENRKTQL